MRAKAMAGFRRGEFQVLVATNIAARGLDVEHITHVISMDVPDVPEDSSSSRYFDMFSALFTAAKVSSKVRRLILCNSSSSSILIFLIFTIAHDV